MITTFSELHPRAELRNWQLVSSLGVVFIGTIWNDKRYEYTDGQLIVVRNILHIVDYKDHWMINTESKDFYKLFKKDLKANEDRIRVEERLKFLEHG